MYHFQRTGSVKGFFLCAENACKLKAEHRSYALSPCTERISHSFGADELSACIFLIVCAHKFAQPAVYDSRISFKLLFHHKSSAQVTFITAFSASSSCFLQSASSFAPVLYNSMASSRGTSPAESFEIISSTFLPNFQSSLSILLICSENYRLRLAVGKFKRYLIICRKLRRIPYKSVVLINKAVAPCHYFQRTE